MKNKYDISLTQEEKEQLISNIKSIVDFLTDLVSGFETSATLETAWKYYDNVWGTKTCRLVVEKTYRYKGICGDSEKEWLTRVYGQIGGLYIDFDRDTEKLSSSAKEYALSLLDNWKMIKQNIIDQANTRNETKQLVKGFEL